QRLIPSARRALLYSVECLQPHIVLLPCRDTYDPACGCEVWPEDLDTDEWFTGRQRRVSIRQFPGTDCRLKNSYDIFVLGRSLQQRPGSRGNNTTTSTLFSLKWTGNIIVIKRGFRDYGTAVNITAPEISLINSLVQRFVIRFSERSRPANPSLSDGFR
ncbi:hypothetical protein FKP32DRAFT_1584107, partial [Trametes sanguinea]